MSVIDIKHKYYIIPGVVDASRIKELAQKCANNGEAAIVHDHARDAKCPGECEVYLPETEEKTKT